MKTLKSILHFFKAVHDAINRKNVILIGGLIIAALVLLMTLIGPYFMPHNPTQMDLANALKAPCSTYLLGTDNMGRDILSRIILGSRESLGIAFFVVLISAVVGTMIGMVSGYFGGAVDMLFMRLVDVFLAFPTIVFVLAVTTFAQASQMNLVIAISCVQWVRYARIARGEAVLIRNAEYIEAAKAMGNSSVSILLRYFLANVAPKILVMMSMDIGSIILYCASLSFLGLGAQPPSPSWGVMISDGKDYIRYAPWMAIYPGVAVAITALGFNMIGDGLRDRIDPRMREAAVQE